MSNFILRVPLALALVANLLPCEANACSCGDADMGAGRLYVGQGGTVPPNASGVPWAGPGHLKRDDERVELRVNGRVTKFSVEEADGVTLLVPEGGLSVAAAIDLRIRENDWRRMAKIRQKVAAEGFDLPPREIRGHVVVTDVPLHLETVGISPSSPAKTDITIGISHQGACSDCFDADGAAFSAVLPSHAEPFADYLLYRTFVDGREWRPTNDICTPLDPGRSWMGKPGVDMVFAECTRRHGGLDQGIHSIWMEVRTPDGRESARTATFQVEVTCDGSDEAGHMHLIDPDGDRDSSPAQTPGGPPPTSRTQEVNSRRDQTTPPSLDASRRHGCALDASSAPSMPQGLLLLLLGWRRSRGRARRRRAPHEASLRAASASGTAGTITPRTRPASPATGSCRLAEVVALCTLGLAACASTSGFPIILCEDNSGRLRHCDCEQPEHTSIQLLGATEVYDYTSHDEYPGKLRKIKDGLPVVIRGYWFEISIAGRREGAASAATWLRCGNDVIAGHLVFRGQDVDAPGAQRFLAYFPLPPEASRLEAPVCEFHVALNDDDGRGVEHHTRMAHVVSAIKTIQSDDGRYSWSFARDRGPRYEVVDPPPLDPPARLCRTTAER